MSNNRGTSTALTLNDVLRILRDHLPALREKYAVKSLAVFGSYVRGEQRRRSDVDVLVEFDVAPDLIRFIRLEDELRHAIGVDVDLVSRGSLRGKRGERILHEAVPL